MEAPDSGRRLKATLGAPSFARVLAMLQRRAEFGKPLTGRLNLTQASEEERSLLNGLLGRKPTRGDSISFELEELEARLRGAGIASDLRAAVEALSGPLVDRRAAAESVSAAWETAWQGARKAWPAHPALLNWLDRLRETGLVRRLSGDSPAEAGQILADVALVLAALPVRGEPLAGFAARVLKDAHALDPGMPRATLAVRGAAELGGIELEDDSEGRRTAWASVGLLCDELSSPVLILNLPAPGDSPLARMLQAGAECGEPLHLSLRLLLRHPIERGPGPFARDIFVCENPTVVAMAASRFGPRCAPLVCVGGQPATPAMVLLRQLAAAGARLRYHGDFDPAGLAIARRLFRELGAEPWRFGAADYSEAPKGKPFAGDPGPTPWSPQLAEVMRHAALAVHEEAAFDLLARDIG